MSRGFTAIAESGREFDSRSGKEFCGAAARILAAAFGFLQVNPRLLPAGGNVESFKGERQKPAAD